MSRRTTSNIDYRNEREYSNTLRSNLFFFWIFLIIVFSWITVDFTARFINNFTFITLGLDEKSPWDTFIIAITIIAIIFTMIIYLKNWGYNLEPSICSEFNNQPNQSVQQNRDGYDYHNNNYSDISSESTESLGFFSPLGFFNHF